MTFQGRQWVRRTEKHSAALPLKERFILQDFSFALEQVDLKRFAVVRVIYAGGHPVDRKAHSNGVDLYGEVVAAQSEELVGKRVVAHLSLSMMTPEAVESRGLPLGSFADYSVVPLEALVEVPPEVSPEQSALVPCAGGTAIQIRMALLPLTDKTNSELHPAIFIRGANGGVGQILIQLLRNDPRFKDTVIIGSARKENHAHLVARGAHGVVDYSVGEEGERAELQRLCKERGWRVMGVVSGVSRAQSARDILLLNHNGVLVSLVGRPTVVLPHDPLPEELHQRIVQGECPGMVELKPSEVCVSVFEIGFGGAYHHGPMFIKRMAAAYQEVLTLAARGEIILPEVTISDFETLPEVLERSERVVFAVNPSCP